MHLCLFPIHIKTPGSPLITSLFIAGSRETKQEKMNRKTRTINDKKEDGKKHPYRKRKKTKTINNDTKNNNNKLDIYIYKKVKGKRKETMVDDRSAGHRS